MSDIIDLRCVKHDKENSDCLHSTSGNKLECNQQLISSFGRKKLIYYTIKILWLRRVENFTWRQSVIYMESLYIISGNAVYIFLQVSSLNSCGNVSRLL